MSETFFPVNDLLRRKLQTSLIVISLTLCIASTLFLLLFGEKIGFKILLTVEGRLTSSFLTVFFSFIMFIAFLIFIVGAIIVSFMVFVMMSQRVKDIGLMKAAGCPNDLIFGYFMTEILIVVVISCFLGVILGILADFASTSLLSSFGFQISQASIDFWLVVLVFLIFFVLALIFGAKPILDTAKVEPAKAISPTYHFGLGKEPGFKATSKVGLTTKIALRSLFRRKSATIRIILCLTSVFILTTVGIAGGIIADQTTKSWIEKATGRDVVLIAHQEMCNQYVLLLSKFYEAKEDSNFNYTNESYLIAEDLLNKLDSIYGTMYIDARLVLKGHVKEVQGYVIDPETGATSSVGNDREGESLIVGVAPENVLSEWFMEGEFLKKNEASEAVIGDSLAQRIFSAPLSQNIRLFDRNFDVVGVCIDPINNSNITYIPIKTLQNITGIPRPNIAMIKVNLANRTEILNQIRIIVEASNPEFAVLELDEVLDKNLGFIGYVWSAILLLPLFSLVSASLCLVGYVMLAIAEQRQEFGVLRALGAKPKTVVKIVSMQSLVALLSSYAVGTAFGIIITLLILVPNPLVTVYTIIEIAGWLLAALTATFIFSLYPAIRFAKKSIPEIMT